ncbi:CHRD domain-containing protein [Nitrospiraceae bacterium HYJII51-Mn-bac16s-1-B09]|uniref:CHRD domain-containing protein n=2 Tax=Candidatus Manganitrophus noduliformans TaxID=2606439 RepID=A0A7X6DSA5_9BACT|nr:CHRD domain-containing protein [Candidatus Manganitrophus noduliformans]
MVLQPDGKILVAGYSNTGGPNHFTLARYNIDGTFDTASFGTNGKGGTVVTPIGTGSIGQAVAIQTDGKVIIAGYSINTGVPSHFTLARYQTSAPPVLLRTTLSGSEEIPAVTTLATGSATFVISPGQNEISYTLHVADIGISGVTAVQIHFGTPGAEGRALFTLTSNSFVSPLVGKLTAADLEPIASTEGINTFSDAIKATRDGNTYIHVHTSTHLGGEIRGQILEAPPTLSQLQAEIFTQQCGAVCHRSGGLGGIETGLFLDTRENAFNLLVNVPSTQDSNFKRVEPFNPDASFLVKKLTDPSLGLMPAGGSPLRAEEIKKVRDWITAGAKND